MRPSLVYQVERELELVRRLALVLLQLDRARRELDHWREELER